MKPTCTSRRPKATSASTTRRPASPVVASGFSHRTGLPAARQARTNASCVSSEEAMTTASTSALWISSSASGSTRIPGPAAAAARARAGSASDTATTSASATSPAMVRRCAAPITPAPMIPMRALTSHRRREVHVPAVTGRVLRLLGPAAGDRLAAGVEPDPFGAVDVMVAEQRVLPPAERVEGHRDRDGDVDADHPDVDAALEYTRG